MLGFEMLVSCLRVGTGLTLEHPVILPIIGFKVLVSSQSIGKGLTKEFLCCFSTMPAMIAVMGLHGT